MTADQDDVGRPLPGGSHDLVRWVPERSEFESGRVQGRAVAELRRLLDVAAHRPLNKALTVRKGIRKGQTVAKLRPEVREQLEELGRERALIYKTLVLTGLRKQELASLTVAQVRLDVSMPYVELDAADEKNREGNSVLIRADLSEDLKRWLGRKLTKFKSEALRRGDPIPTGLTADTPVFKVPKGLIRIFDRDLKAAGIAKRDERKRTLDVHALRTTFGTLLSKAGVPLRTAQAAMRHSDPSLTANVYTDPKLLDVHGALDALPNLSFDCPSTPEREQARATATGTCGDGDVALRVALPVDKSVEMVVSPDKTKAEPPNFLGPPRLLASGLPDKRKSAVTTPVIPCGQVEDRGLEPLTSCMPYIPADTPPVDLTVLLRPMLRRVGVKHKCLHFPTLYDTFYAFADAQRRSTFGALSHAPGVSR
jgi:integrase